MCVCVSAYHLPIFPLSHFLFRVTVGYDFSALSLHLKKGGGERGERMSRELITTFSPSSLQRGDQSCSSTSLHITPFLTPLAPHQSLSDLFICRPYSSLIGNLHIHLRVFTGNPMMSTYTHTHTHNSDMEASHSL